MRYRRFGKTGLEMPALTLGLMRSMHSWTDLPLDQVPAENQANLAAIVHRALDSGITHLETARGYGSAERQLGRIIATIPRHRFLLQTKVPPHDDPARFTAEVEDSLARLGVDYVDLLAIHGINDFRSFWQTCRPGGCLAAARRLQDAGRVRHVGFSGHGDTDVQLAAVSHEDDGGFDYVNLHWYYIFQQHRPVLEAAAQRDLGVLIISPSDKGGMLQEPSPRFRELTAPLAPMVFNDLFCLAQPEIHTITVGAARPEDLDLHLEAAAGLATHLPEVAAADQRLQRAMTEATGHPRPDALWAQLPPWDRTPGHVNLRFILWLFNLARGWDLTAYARARYRKIGVEVPWVPGAPAADLQEKNLAKHLARRGLNPDAIIAQLRQAHALLA